MRDCVHIKAPIERCFLLSTNQELARRTLGLRVARRRPSRCSGLIMEGERFARRNWWLGLPHTHESVVSRCEPPSYLQDTMVRGRFRRLQHEHQFIEIEGHVLLTATVRFSLPMGRAGRWIGRRLTVPRVSAMLRSRLELLRKVAETDEWKRYLEECK